MGSSESSRASSSTASASTPACSSSGMKPRRMLSKAGSASRALGAAGAAVGAGVSGVAVGSGEGRIASVVGACLPKPDPKPAGVSGVSFSARSS